MALRERRYTPHLYWDNQPRRCAFVGRSAFGNNEAHSLRVVGVTETQYLLQIVHFDQSDSDGVINTADDCGVLTWRKICDDCRLARISRSQSAINDFLNLAVRDNAADNRVPPVIIGANQSASAIVQFDCGISQYIRHSKSSKFRANGANNH